MLGFIGYHSSEIKFFLIVDANSIYEHTFLQYNNI